MATNRICPSERRRAHQKMLCAPVPMTSHVRTYLSTSTVHDVWRLSMASSVCMCVPPCEVIAQRCRVGLTNRNEVSMHGENQSMRKIDCGKQDKHTSRYSKRPGVRNAYHLQEIRPWHKICLETSNNAMSQRTDCSLNTRTASEEQESNDRWKATGVDLSGNRCDSKVTHHLG